MVPIVLTSGGDLEQPESLGVLYWKQLCAMFGIPRSAMCLPADWTWIPPRRRRFDGGLVRRHAAGGGLLKRRRLP